MRVPSSRLRLLSLLLAALAIWPVAAQEATTTLSESDLKKLVENLREARLRLGSWESSLTTREAGLQGKELFLLATERNLNERESALGQTEAHLSEREAALKQSETRLDERENGLQGSERALIERERTLSEREKALPENERIIAELNISLTKASVSLAEANNEAQALLFRVKVFKAVAICGGVVGVAGIIYAIIK